ncbi:hypothetical protein BJV77DRAFT_977456 [Russula vinacea]|nr:hypothetical protein BJV77DRAFT_977456 [Russula vinacea]
MVSSWARQASQHRQNRLPPLGTIAVLTTRAGITTIFSTSLQINILPCSKFFLLLPSCFCLARLQMAARFLAHLSSFLCYQSSYGFFGLSDGRVNCPVSRVVMNDTSTVYHTWPIYWHLALTLIILLLGFH